MKQVESATLEKVLLDISAINRIIGRVSFDGFYSRDLARFCQLIGALESSRELIEEYFDGSHFAGQTEMGDEMDYQEERKRSALKCMMGRDRENIQVLNFLFQNSHASYRARIGCDNLAEAARVSFGPTRIVQVIGEGYQGSHGFAIVFLGVRPLIQVLPDVFNKASSHNFQLMDNMKLAKLSDTDLVFWQIDNQLSILWR